jgi:type I restriction enzyme R subunit
MPPSFKEDHISQILALKLMMNMDWKYLSLDQAFGRYSENTINENQ